MDENLKIPADQPAEVIVVLDRSGSMHNIWQDTMGGLKSFVDDYKATAPHAKLTVVLFNHNVATPYSSVPMSDVPDFVAGGEFTPSGNTAMLDAICQGIDEAGKRFGEYAEDVRSKLRVVCAIITDGQENSSREATYESTKARIEKQSKEFGWQFTFLGADQDAVLAGSKIGISGANSADFAKNAQGVNAVFRSSSDKARRYGASGAVGAMAYTADDRKTLKADAK